MNMYKYVVSFGQKKNPITVTFYSFNYAKKFLDDLVEEGQINVRLDTIMEGESENV